MSDDDLVEPQSLREKTVFLLACGGILLLLGLILGVLVSRQREQTAEDVQRDEIQGHEQALFVDGVAPRAVPKDAQFEVRAKVTNVGVDTLQDVVLSIGAQRLIMPVPEGTEPTLQIDVLRPGESRELIATLKAIEPGATSIAAHAKDATKRVASGRYFEIQVLDGTVPKVQYLPGAGMSLRISTFGPTDIDPDRPFELLTVVENSGQMPIETLRLSIRAGDGIEAKHDEALDYEVPLLPPNEAQAVRALFKVTQPIARGQIHVYAHDAAGWVAGIALHIVTPQR